MRLRSTAALPMIHRRSGSEFPPTPPRINYMLIRRATEERRERRRRQPHERAQCCPGHRRRATSRSVRAFRVARRSRSRGSTPGTTFFTMRGPRPRTTLHPSGRTTAAQPALARVNNPHLAIVCAAITNPWARESGLGGHRGARRPDLKPRIKDAPRAFASSTNPRARESGPGGHRGARRPDLKQASKRLHLGHHLCCHHQPMGPGVRARGPSGGTPPRS